MNKSCETYRYLSRRILALVAASVLCLLFPMQLYSQTIDNLDVRSPKKILVVGDSLSAAYKLPKEKGWVHLMHTKIKQAGLPYQVINASVSGATTAAGLSVMERSLSIHSPDIVILELGANDGLQGKPIAYITQNLERMIASAKASGAAVVLLGVRLPPNFGAKYTKPFFQQFDILAQRHGVGLVPFMLDKVAGIPELMMSDGLHPNVRGQRVVLDNIWPVLQKELMP